MKFISVASSHTSSGERKSGSSPVGGSVGYVGVSTKLRIDVHMEESTFAVGGVIGAGGAARRARKTERNIGRAKETLPVVAKWVAIVVAASTTLGVTNGAEESITPVLAFIVFAGSGRPAHAMSRAHWYMSSAESLRPLKASQSA